MLLAIFTALPFRPMQLLVSFMENVFCCVSGRPVVNKSSIVYVAKGSHPYLYCGVRYDPKVNATFRWYFKGDQVRNDGKRELKYDGRLVIKGVSEQEGGIYRCEARSVVGNYSTTVEVIVQGK